MNGETVTLGTSMALIFAGLLALLYGEYAGLTVTFVPTGGVVVLVGIGILTAYIARLPESDDTDAGH
ncbi:hypothetical protein GL213_07870 [Halogeometricum borinquense]|uniref:Uncharacterized protein n=1 Tax=Halogeometricum borinquense TaxID=60847 RepID=A0A482TFB0_9EURY|nr:hypothetical protein [Halogeometricum borinquense]QIB74607.1 hypothetical protein G3I44_10105 [Halogeometricum borinquense]QIQ76443.1 hypothetical protein GL213_07870 [Halogeometricum borinquense]RYJ13888.1 hypothetical protein ELS19_07850 [Halogeometricum borinquense]